MFEWIPVESSVITAEAFDPETDTIYVRFKNGQEWAYSACPQHVWEEFTAPGMSRGVYLNKVLKFKPNSRHVS
jgi:hypothetical protein